MITHGGHHFFQRHGVSGLHVEWHHFRRTDVFAVHKGYILLHARGKAVEETPNAGFAETLRTEVGRRIGFRERELGIAAFEITFRTGERDHVFGVHHILFVLQIEAVNTALVGVRADAVVGDAHSHPHSAFGRVAFTDHFEDPSLVGVGNRERFALRCVTMAGYKARHHADGFASRLGALQSERHERHIVDTAHRILRPEFFAAAESRFGDGQLVFVDVAHHIISVGCLGDFAEGLVGVAVYDFAHRTGRVLARWIVEQAAVHAVGVGTVSDETLSVFRGFLAYQQIGASRRRKGEQDGKQGENSIHLQGIFNFVSDDAVRQ